MRKVIFYLIIILSLPTILWASDPFTGTWKLNIEKSNFPPNAGDRIPKGEIVVFKKIDEKFEITVTKTNADGSTTITKSFVPKHGGTVKNEETNISDGEFEVWTRINLHESIVTTLREGRQWKVSQFQVSEDGKSQSQIVKITFRNGNTIEMKTMWDRQ